MIIRDAVHGDIELSHNESLILDTPQVQRLRGIKQLGAAYYVYPSATHTRFEHSLGTLFTSQKIINHLKEKKFNINKEIEAIIRTAALLHDITHIPFGHTFEDERKLMERHDKGNRYQLLTNDTALGDALKKQGIKEEVESIVENKSHPNVPKWARQIVSSTLDADLLDYLKRDNFFTGLSQNYDDRFFNSFIIEEEELGLNMIKRGMDRLDILTEVMNLLRLRYFLTERVYYHHTKVIAGSMISKALESAFENGLTEYDLLPHNDGSFFELLRNYGEESKNLIEKVSSRKLYKRCYIISYQNTFEGIPEHLISQFTNDSIARNRAEKEIAILAEVDFKDVIFYCSSLPSNKEAAVKVKCQKGWHPFNQVGASQAYQELSILNSKYKHLWKLYIMCPDQYIQKVAIASEKFFGIKNELLS